MTSELLLVSNKQTNVPKEKICVRFYNDYTLIGAGN